MNEDNLPGYEFWALVILVFGTMIILGGIK